MWASAYIVNETKNNTTKYTMRKRISQPIIIDERRHSILWYGIGRSHSLSLSFILFACYFLHFFQFYSFRFISFVSLVLFAQLVKFIRGTYSHSHTHSYKCIYIFMLVSHKNGPTKCLFLFLLDAHSMVRNIFI